MANLESQVRDNRPVFLSFAVLGLVAGIPAGPIMSLPAKVLPPENWALGMGIFYTLFYLLVVLAPLGAGRLADIFGRINIAFDLGVAMLADSIVLLIVYRRFAEVCVRGQGQLGAHELSTRLSNMTSAD